MNVLVLLPAINLATSLLSRVARRGSSLFDWGASAAPRCGMAYVGRDLTEGHLLLTMGCGVTIRLVSPSSRVQLTAFMEAATQLLADIRLLSIWSRCRCCVQLVVILGDPLHDLVLISHGLAILSSRLVGLIRCTVLVGRKFMFEIFLALVAPVAALQIYAVLDCAERAMERELVSSCRIWMITISPRPVLLEYGRRRLPRC